MMALASVIVLAALSVALGALSLAGVLAPHRFVAFGRGFVAKAGPGGVVAVRLLLAGATWLAAPVSSTPAVFRIVAVAVLAGAVVAMALGAGGMLRLLDRVADRGPVAIRLPCAAGLALAGFLLWSVAPAIGVF